MPRDQAGALSPETLDGPSWSRRLAREMLPAFCSAGLLWLAYPLPDLGWVAWFALAPWMTTVVRARTNAVAWLTWPVWLTWWVFMVRWLYYATGLGWLALAFYLSLYFPAAALLVRLFNRRLGLPATLAVPVAWVALEHVRGWLLTGFAWFYLGHTQHRALAVIQVADLGGVGLVSFVVAAVNGLVVDVLTRPLFRSRPGRARARVRRGVVGLAAFVAALVAGTIIYGGYRLAEGRRTITEGPLVGVVQGNIPQQVIATGAQSDEAVLDHHVRLAEALIAEGQPLDLIVWPETMVPGSINDEYLRLDASGEEREALRRHIAWSEFCRSEVVRLAGAAQAPILVGNLATEVDASGEVRRYNAALLVDASGRTLGRYDKMHLVPFGEYVPLRDTFPWLMKLTPYDYDYTVQPGARPTVFEAGGARFAVAICFESTVSGVVRRLVNGQGQGGPVDFVVNISNDGWFYGSSELPQHLAICAFRAVENRVGIVRSVNTGISAFIDPNGRVVKELADAAGRTRCVEGTLVGRAAVDGRRSVYSRAGDWLGAVLTGLSGLGVVYGIGAFVVGRDRAWRAKKSG